MARRSRWEMCWWGKRKGGRKVEQTGLLKLKFAHFGIRSFSKSKQFCIQEQDNLCPALREICAHFHPTTSLPPSLFNSIQLRIGIRHRPHSIDTMSSFLPTPTVECDQTGLAPCSYNSLFVLCTTLIRPFPTTRLKLPLMPSKKSSQTKIC